jgi:hypothetical protein
MSDDSPKYIKDDIVQEPHFNYKGIFFNDNAEKRFFEGGAHFSYRDLYKRLVDLCRSLTPERVSNNNIIADSASALSKNFHKKEIKKFYENFPSYNSKNISNINRLYKVKKLHEDYKLEKERENKFSFIKSPIKADISRTRNVQQQTDFLDKLHSIKESSTSKAKRTKAVCEIKNVSILSPDLLRKTAGRSFYQKTE